MFAKLSLQEPNVLVLDEPTNHLDLESIEALVEGLKKFGGTLIFASTVYIAFREAPARGDD